jgi:hypothetical protein
MKLKRIIYNPQAEITLCRMDILVLKDMGERHYDGVCQRAVAHGGFIYGWYMRLDDGPGLPDRNQTFKVTATFEELDLACKIVELAGPEGNEPGRVLHEQLRAALVALRTAYETVNRTTGHERHRKIA